MTLLITNYYYNEFFFRKTKIFFYQSKSTLYIYTVKFDITEPSVPLVKICQNPLYREFRCIENRFIMDYDNLFQTPVPLHQEFYYVPVYRDSVISNFTVYHTFYPYRSCTRNSTESPKLFWISEFPELETFWKTRTYKKNNKKNVNKRSSILK